MVIIFGIPYAATTLLVDCCHQQNVVALTDCHVGVYSPNKFDPCKIAFYNSFLNATQNDNPNVTKSAL